MTQAFARISLGTRSESRTFMMGLARALKEQFGSIIHLYCNGPQEVTHYENLNADGIFDTINNADILLKAGFEKDLEEERVLARAVELEKLTGLTINRMAVPHRHFGRGYALGGFHHPRSRYSEKIDYLHMVHAYSETLDYWDQEFSEKNITLCLNGPREAAYIAHSRGLPYRSMALSRYENYHYWAWNELYESPLIEQAFSTSGGQEDIDLTRPYSSHLAYRSAYLKSFSFGVMVKNIVMLTARYAYWHLRGYEKRKGYYFRENAKLYLKIWRDYRHLMSLDLQKLSDLQGRRFVYYPLHIEPEIALHGFSPEYFYQQALIAAVSRDLPAGVFLAVKEAVGAIGRRPDHFYRQIADLKNVVLLDPWEMGIQCAQSSDAVVTICGTSGLEALSGGKPVIAFGRHNIYNQHSAVQIMTDETQLRDQLNRALNGTYDHDAIKREARKLLGAIVDCSFDMGAFDYLDFASVEDPQVQAALSSLEETLSENETDVRVVAH